jgi:hypothetical protein
VGGSKKPKQDVTDYLLSIHCGVCHMADSIERIRYDDKVIFEGRASTNGPLSINNPSLFGGPKKEGGVRGLIEVLLGGVTQVLPDRLIAKLGQGADGTPGFRGITSIFFSGGGSEPKAGFMWGSNSPYLKAIDVTARRMPKGFYAAKAWVPAYSGQPLSECTTANPAHIIYECLVNDDWGLGLPDTMLDTASFTAAADILYDEMFGLAMKWVAQSSIEDFINEVLGHIDGTHGIDPQTGKVYLSLVRGGYSEVGLFNLNPDNCTVTRFQRKSLSETVNEIVVTWTNPENENEETVSVHDLANYSSQAKLSSSASNYYGVRSADLALRLAMRDLARGACPLASFEVDADRAAWALKPGGVATLTWPEYGIDALPVRITGVNYGRPGASKVQVTLLEDVFSMPATAYVDVSSSLDDNPRLAQPGPLDYFQGGSTPYYFVSQEIGSAEASAMAATSSYITLLGASDEDLSTIEMMRPSTNSLGTTTYLVEGNLPVSGHAILHNALVVEALSAGVIFDYGVGNVDADLGVFVWIGTNPSTSELALISAKGGTYTIKRGVLDTVPKVWAAGTPVWFFGSSDISDEDEFLVGQTVNYKLVPQSMGGLADISGVPINAVTTDNRQHRPYRPANVKINTEAWPIEAESPLVVSFSRRNRLTEEPVVQDWTGGDMTPEAGQTVTATLRRVDTNAVLVETTGIAGTSVTLSSTYKGDVSLTLTSVRGGLSSYQPSAHSFALISRRITEAGVLRITEAGVTRIME